ncbi:nicotinate-nucleotide diphosphorylase (carboxylating), partial [Candidatus Woesearchaeota archaeon]|nr:nicotinate-nucleotide diphosphorylase (carboxylating) [Candidatus Woesearchaeota archaeon]
MKNKDYKNFVSDLMELLLKSDVKSNDITTNPLIKNKIITAYIVAKEEGIIAGLEEFSLLNKDLKLKFQKKDGEKARDGEIIAEIGGDANKILQWERVNLDLLQRMSGIATSVNSLNSQLKGKVKIAATRKTLWGLMDKKAVSVGGGLTHRLNLNDVIIIKENHLKILNYKIEKALDISRKKSRYVEIEVESKEHALEASKSIKKLNNKN